MTPQELKDRLTRFSVDIVKLTTNLRARPEARRIADQLCDSGTSVAANYRSACRARSHREFVSKLGIAVEEADETVGWLELIEQAGLEPRERVTPTLREAGELLAILAASRQTAEARRKGQARP